MILDLVASYTFVAKENLKTSLRREFFNFLYQKKNPDNVWRMGLIPSSIHRGVPFSLARFSAQTELTRKSSQKGKVINMNNQNPEESIPQEESISAHQNLPENLSEENDEMKIIHIYTRKEAFADGVLVDLWEGDLKEICLEHFKAPIAFTAAVWTLVEKAMHNPKYDSDYSGILHDIFFMSKGGKKVDEQTRTFGVYLGAPGTTNLIPLKVFAGPGDDAELVLTFMLVNED